MQGKVDNHFIYNPFPSKFGSTQIGELYGEYPELFIAHDKLLIERKFKC